MIKKVRSRFVMVSMTALFVLLAVIVAGMNIMNYNSVITEADETLSLLTGNGGKFSGIGMEKPESLPRNMSPEVPYEARYFSVLFNQKEELIQIDTRKIKAVDSEQAAAYAGLALEKEQEKGFIEDYRYIKHSDAGGMKVTFLDCGRKMHSYRMFLIISIGMAFAGYLLFFFVILVFSDRILKPVTESYEKQKRFITDAGHEIKTPLTIIQADADVLEMDYGENEWVTDIQKQAKRLTALTNDLVYLSRMEEQDHSIQMIEFPFSDIVSETAASFQALAQTQGKVFECSVQPMLSLRGNEKAIAQLVSILLDNALKYSPEHGTVSLKLEKKNRSVQLSVYNTIEGTLTKEELSQLFERFYRRDASHNSQTGGYGIGLSLAKAIVTAHGGRIQAKSEDGRSLMITVCLTL